VVQFHSASIKSQNFSFTKLIYCVIIYMVSTFIFSILAKDLVTALSS